MVSRNRAPAILAHACIDPWRSSFAFGTAVIVGFLLARQYDTRHIYREGDESDVHAGHVQAGLRTLRGRSPDQRLPPASALLAGRRLCRERLVVGHSQASGPVGSREGRRGVHVGGVFGSVGFWIAQST